MKDTKLTVRVSKELLENVKIYAAKNKTTLTGLIEAYLQNIPTQKTFENSPIVSRLSGTLPQNVSIQDYKNHLEEKYGK